MDDLTFKREQKRREVQEILNHLDAASTAEEGSDKQEKDDQMAAVKLTPLTMDMKEYVELIVARYITEDQ